MGIVDPRALSAPAPLAEHHQFDGFRSGIDELDRWLIERAHRNEREGGSRTYVIDEGDVVVAYYSLAAGGVDRESAPKSLARNMPDPIPVIVLGRLAVDQRYQRAGIGKSLLRDAFRRVVLAAEIVAVRGVLVHAINSDAREYYLRWGFKQSPTDEMSLALGIGPIRKLVIPETLSGNASSST